MSYLLLNLTVNNLPNVMKPEENTEAKRYERRQISAEWRVPIHGTVYRIEFEHGTTTGKRVIWVNAKEILRRDWMFRLVGEDVFTIDDTRCIIRVNPAPGLRYIYSLSVDGKSLKQFAERQARTMKAWTTKINDKNYRIVLEKDTLNIFVNGEMIEVLGEFVEGGTDTTFCLDGIEFKLQARTPVRSRKGIMYTLWANEIMLAETEAYD